jgi:hypothetical protein
LGALAAVAALSATPGAVREWLATHWLFTYREGLGRRAVVGSVLDAARGGSPPSLALITVLSLVALAGLAALLVALAVRALRADPRPGTLLVVAWLFASPATLRFVAQDLGRFDTINLAIVVGVLLLLPRCSRAVALALVAVACATGVAVHEAFLVLHVPLLLVVTAVVVAPVGGDTGRTTFGVERRTWVAVAATGFPAVATYLWVQLGAGIDAAAVPGVLAELRARTDFHVSEDSLLVQARGLGEVQAYTTGGLAGAGPAQVAALFATILVACLPVLVIVGRRLWRSSGERVPAAPRDGRLGLGSARSAAAAPDRGALAPAAPAARDRLGAVVGPRGDERHARRAVVGRTRCRWRPTDPGRVDRPRPGRPWLVARGRRVGAGARHRRHGWVPPGRTGAVRPRPGRRVPDRARRLTAVGSAETGADDPAERGRTERDHQREGRRRVEVLGDGGRRGVGEVGDDAGLDPFRCLSHLAAAAQRDQRADTEDDVARAEPADGHLAAGVTLRTGPEPPSGRPVGRGDHRHT